MLTERLTQLEMLVDSLQQRTARSEMELAATKAALETYKRALPEPRGYFASLELPEGTTEIAGRRAVLAALQSVVPEDVWVEVQVRCFEYPSSEGRQLAVLFSGHTLGPRLMIDAGQLYASLAAVGEVHRWHCALSDMEEQHYCNSLRATSVFSLVRAGAQLAALPARYRTYLAEDVELGFCRIRSPPLFSNTPQDETDEWARVTGFNWWLPQQA